MELENRKAGALVESIVKERGSTDPATGPAGTLANCSVYHKIIIRSTKIEAENQGYFRVAGRPIRGDSGAPPSVSEGGSFAIITPSRSAVIF